ncbi:MAG: GGDEF domain-containing protein [Burkholderiales bacterium]|nr:GGDEF domain-containing protein [Burkholderiales bacterium]
MNPQTLPAPLLPAAGPPTLADLLLGRDPRQRLRVSRSLLAAQAYLVCVALMGYAVWADFMQPRPALVLSGLIVANILVFYAVLRSGFNQRFAEPALTLPQILSALTWIVGAYAITGPIHGSTMMLLALVLMFGTFNLDARGARIASAYSVVLLGATIVYKIFTEPHHYSVELEVANFVLAATTMPTVSALAAQLARMRARLRAQKDELALALERIQLLATRDDLTGLFNRRHMLEVLEQERRRAARSGSRFCVAILDLDHFKHVNDTHGHAVGDEVLRQFAQQALAVLREADVLARWGGEEFLLLLADGDTERARQAVERLRDHLLDHPGAASVPSLRIRFSAGLTAYLPGEALDATIERADRALYCAKAHGRSRTQVG